MQDDNTPFFRFAMNMSLAHRDYFRTQKLSDAQNRMFEQEATQSLIQQREIEASETISFDEYLRRYFAQDDVNRERALG